MIVVEGMGDLIHDEVRILEKAQHSIIEFDTHVIFVLFQAERAEKEIFHPVIVQLFDEAIQIFRLDDPAEF